MFITSPVEEKDNMARDLHRVKTRDEAIDFFDNNILPAIQRAYEKDGRPDWPARREAFNNWTDALCKNHEISDWQYENWTHPPSCER